MLYRVIDLRYSKVHGGIDDEPLQRLCHGHEVVSRIERLYHHDGEPHLLVSVLYRLATLAAPPRSANTNAVKSSSPTARCSRERKDEEWKSILQENDTKLFETLRAWRTRRARADAVPPYVVLTNLQLARVANIRPRSLSALGEMKRIGGLFDEVASFDNLYRAYIRARRGKRDRPSVDRFSFDLERELLLLRDELLHGLSRS